jgi:hypothetical protein
VTCCFPADEKLEEQGIDAASLQEPLRKGNSSSSPSLTNGSSTQQAEQQEMQPNQQQQQAASTENGSAALDTQGYSAQDAGRGEAARARCLQAMAGFSETFLQIIAGTPATCLVEHGIYVRPAAAMTAAAYGSNRVVVMGDAAHPLRPTGELAPFKQCAWHCVLLWPAGRPSSSAWLFFRENWCVRVRCSHLPLCASIKVT